MRQNIPDDKFAAIKRRNTEVFKETMQITRSGHLTNGIDISEANSSMTEGSIMYDKALNANNINDCSSATAISTINNDCLLVAADLVQQGYNPVLLNMASGGHPGGGVENGARAQEETICRRTTLAASIFMFSKIDSAKYGLPHKIGPNYPMQRNFGAVYSPQVTVFRAGAETDYTILDEPFQIGVVSVAAINKNKFPEHFQPDGTFSQSGITIVLNRIRTIFRIGLIHSHDALIIGAWGCGAFHNNPYQMARLFRQTLDEPEFKNKYRTVVAAVIEDHNSDNRNFTAFKENFH